MKRIAVIALPVLLQGCETPVEAIRDSIKADLERSGELRCEVTEPEAGAIREQCWKQDTLYVDCTNYSSGLVACRFPEGVPQ